MDDRRFDAIVKGAAGRASRRSTLKLLASAALGAAGLVRRGDVAAAPSAKVAICHQPGTAHQRSLAVAAAAVPAHLGHGDYLHPDGCCPASTVVVRHDDGSADCCAPKATCGPDDCGEVGDGCGGALSCAPCPTSCPDEICDVRDDEGTPGLNATCTCGCPDGAAVCRGEKTVGADVIVTAACCPGNGICDNVGAQNGFFGNFCCDPDLTHLTCTYQARYVVGYAEQIICDAPSGPTVNCAGLSRGACNDLCARTISG